MEMRPFWRREVSGLHSQHVGFRLRKGWAWDTGSGLGNMQGVVLRPGCCQASSAGLKHIRGGICVPDTLTQGSGSPGFSNPHSFTHSSKRSTTQRLRCSGLHGSSRTWTSVTAGRRPVGVGHLPAPLPHGLPITRLHSAQGCRKAGRGRFPGLPSSLGTPRAHSPRRERGRGQGRAPGCPQGLFP